MEQLKLFIEKAKTDSELMAKINAFGANNANADEIITLAAEHGFTVTKTDLEAVACGGSGGELSEEHLENVSGGFGSPTENRWDPNVCPGLTRTRYECVGLFQLCNCDHYRKKGASAQYQKQATLYYHTCVMGAFNYIGYGNGAPK